MSNNSNNIASVYAPPIAPARQQAASTPTQASKRKRQLKSGILDHHEQSGLEESSHHNAEYAAIISPDERSQRRLAGHPLNEALPLRPFPHRDTNITTKNIVEDTTASQPSDGQSLRIQHVTAMTTVLHKCLLKHDYTRASRAIGLLLRTDIAGHSVDIRHGELWAIGAEVLFRQNPDPDLRFSRAGFEKAKDYYEKLIIKFPVHRASLENTNAIDFYMAMFSLWLHVAQAERQAAYVKGDVHEAATRELDQAKAIASCMDKCMSSAPYIDYEDLVSLRADVKLWQADLERQSPHAVDGPLGDDTALYLPHECAFGMVLSTGARILYYY